MPAFLDFYSIERYTEDDLKKGQKEPRDEFGVKTINISMTWIQAQYFVC
jgi:hypothetical protein